MRYATAADGFILACSGPDGAWNLDLRTWRPEMTEADAALSNYTYDPTNGTISARTRSVRTRVCDIADTPPHRVSERAHVPPLVSRCDTPAVPPGESAIDEVCDRDTLAAVGAATRRAGDERMTAQVLADNLAQRAGALPVNDPYEWQTGQIRIVEILLEARRHVGCTPSTHVERQRRIGYGRQCHRTGRCNRTPTHAMVARRAGSTIALQLLQRHTHAEAANLHISHGVLVIDREHLADEPDRCHMHPITRLQRPRRRWATHRWRRLPCRSELARTLTRLL
jgi:hypothetical protein